MTFEPTIPPPSPKTLIPMIGIMCLVAGLVLAVAYCEVGCAEPPAKYPAYCTDEVAFTARLVACVDYAAAHATSPDHLRSLSRECKESVHERCGIKMTTTRKAEVAP
jgi:hypothetical protein